MNVTLHKSELSKVLAITQSVVEKRNTMPILANVLISASEGLLKLSATDLEITAVASTPAKVTSRGSTTVNARVFGDIVKELPDAEVTIHLADGERLEITSKSSKLRIIGVSAQEYPSLPGISIDTKSKISSRLLLEMINRSIYAVSMDETRFNLNGVCFEMVDAGGKGSKKGHKSLRMVATDGHRLALITRSVENMNFAEKVIVPRKGLTELRRILDDQGDKEIGIEISDGFLVIEGDNSKISMRLIDGEFPDYTRVFPEKEGVKCLISTNEIAQALRRVALLVSDKQKCVKLDLSPSTLRISSSSPELGDASEELQVEFKGKPFSVGFNAKYLIDITQTIGEDQRMVMELNGDTGPGKFYAENDESCLGIVMPMRLV